MDLGRDMETPGDETQPLSSETDLESDGPSALFSRERYAEHAATRMSRARAPWGSSVVSTINRWGRGKVALASALAVVVVVGLTASGGSSKVAAKAVIVAHRPALQMLQAENSSTANASHATGHPVKNYGEDCWSACGDAGFCQEFCGQGNACCRFLGGTDPPECHGIADYGSQAYHTCVAPVNPTFFVKASEEKVQHWGEDCLTTCAEAGYCQEFCGMGNACCKFGAASDPAECGGVAAWGSKDRHTCVSPVRPEYVVALSSNSTTMQNWGQDCWEACGDAGLCQEFCGQGNACCRFKSHDDPGECHGVTEFGSKDRHTCVVPVNFYFLATLEATPGVQNWGQDCLGLCNNAGYCQEFCGMGNACCKWGEANAPAECQGVTALGSKERHTCVAPVSPAFKTAPKTNETSVLQWGNDCWQACDGAGYCPKFCGMGNACCRFGSAKDPAECKGVADFGAKDRHTCVAPVDVTWKVQTNSTVKQWGEDCWSACNRIGGVCPDFCGLGNACCAFGSGEDPPECHGIAEWGAKDKHTCVRPVDQLYVNHLSEDCWSHCDGAGMCEAWCGAGNACCRFYEGSDPDECKGVTYWPIHSHHTCVKATSAHPGVPDAPAESECIPGEVRNAEGACRKAANTTIMTFYMYRATNDKWGAHLANANLGNVDGVLWFLHNQVVTSCPRKENINRIVRYVVTMRNPATLFEGNLHFQFGQYTDFQEGKCMFNNSNCSDLWKKYGYAVGCQPLDTLGVDLPNYPGSPVWYSVPGPCPAAAMDWAGAKPFGCWTDEPGGICASPDGTKNCTWKAEYAGEIRVDELSGVTDPAGFCSAGNKEYDPDTDAGVGTTFWNDRRSAEQGKRRADYVRELFAMKYPNYPATLGEPKCDWWR